MAILKKSPSPMDNPLFRQWAELKALHPHALLAVRLGDFYEFFFEDAQAASKVMQITVTTRQGIPMAGFPYWGFEKYISTALNAGHSIVVAEINEEILRYAGRLKYEIVSLHVVCRSRLREV